MDETAPQTPAATAAQAQSRTNDAAPPPSASEAEADQSNVDVNFGIGEGVEQAVHARSHERSRADPLYRPLKIYTVDPSARRLEGATAKINIAYEPLEPGPKGVRFEVVAGERTPFGATTKVDLDDKRVLINNGYDPAPSNPAFHHQMIYAVCSSVYSAFRAALGRELAWGFGDERLKIFPHAGEAGSDGQGDPAVYDPQTQSIVFRWFVARDPETKARQPGYVFPCLSHDIVAHELTHALLDGLRARFREPVNRDVSAFHEAFADVVALLQRFSYKEVVKSAVRKTGGDLTRNSILLQIGCQYGNAQEGRPVRQVQLQRKQDLYSSDLDTYKLGTVMVSAIFEAFVTLYKRKAAPYLRLASQGTGIFPKNAELPPDLLEILAHVASRAASQYLAICIRAIDYCPPVAIELGEYLRAMITADADLVPDDPWAYREALIEAFSRRRVYPSGVPALSEDALLWDRPETALRVPGLDFASLRFSGDPASPAGRKELRRQACALGAFVTQPKNLDLFGLAAQGDLRLNGDAVDLPVVESIRSSRRAGPDGQMVFDLVAEITQKRIVAGGNGKPAAACFGGSTVILDPKGEVRYIIRKGVADEEEIGKQCNYLRTNNVELITP